MGNTVSILHMLIARYCADTEFVYIPGGENGSIQKKVQESVIPSKTKQKKHSSVITCICWSYHNDLCHSSHGKHKHSNCVLYLTVLLLTLLQVWLVKNASKFWDGCLTPWFNINSSATLQHSVWYPCLVFSMGMSHDDDHATCTGHSHIMSGEWVKGRNPSDLSWSSCSRDDLENFLRWDCFYSHVVRWTVLYCCFPPCGVWKDSKWDL